jgi:hypothetical protein
VSRLCRHSPSVPVLAKRETPGREMLIRRPPLCRAANGSASPRNGSQYLSCAQAPEFSVTADYMILLESSRRLLYLGLELSAPHGTAESGLRPRPGSVYRWSVPAKWLGTTVGTCRYIGNSQANLRKSQPNLRISQVRFFQNFASWP